VLVPTVPSVSTPPQVETPVVVAPQPTPTPVPQPATPPVAAPQAPAVPTQPELNTGTPTGVQTPAAKAPWDEYPRGSYMYYKTKAQHDQQVGPGLDAWYDFEAQGINGNPEAVAKYVDAHFGGDANNKNVWINHMQQNYGSVKPAK
jgi:hypothetical protein